MPLAESLMQSVRASQQSHRKQVLIDATAAIISALPQHQIPQILPRVLAALPAERLADLVPPVLLAVPPELIRSVLPAALELLPATNVPAVVRTVVVKLG